MSKRLVMAIPDEHYAWLEDVRTEKGLESVQAVARTIIADAYESKKKRRKHG